MSCNKPLKGFFTGEKTKNGKDDLIIVPFKTHHLEITENGIERNNYAFISYRCIKPIFKYIEIPCGKCIGCKLDYSSQWADRMMAEKTNYPDDEVHFITLTYDNDHIPMIDTYDVLTGEDHKINTLSKRDIQLFMKRLRKSSENKLRFYLCGEYGSNTCRPHYHIILYGMKFDDLLPIGNSALNNKYFYSPSLIKIWPYGQNVVAECNWQTCAYTARYVTKKLDDHLKEFYKRFPDVQKEFCLMSRKPGIGKDYIDKNSDKYFQYQQTYLNTYNGSRKISLNRYFINQLDKIDEALTTSLRDKRKQAASDRVRFEMLNTSIDQVEYLSLKDELLKNRSKKLIRSFEDN